MTRSERTFAGAARPRHAPPDLSKTAEALRHCLVFLEREAKKAGFKELAELIGVAALSAKDTGPRPT